MSPLSPQQTIQLALQHHRAGNLRDAETLYRQVLAIDPNHPPALHYLGLIAQQTARLDESLHLLRRSVELDPNDPGTRHDLAGTLMLRGSLDEAEREYVAAAGLAPRSPLVQSDLSCVYLKQRRYAEALAATDQAIRLGDDGLRVHFLRAQVLTALGRLPEAIAEYQQSLQRQPGHIESMLGLAEALFLQGDLKPAFELYESRLRSGETSLSAQWSPRWTGRENLAGKTIMVIAEQGVGDTIQFARYLPLLKQRGAAQVILLCLPETRTLFQSLADVQVIASGETPPPIHGHVPILSLPRIFGTTLQTIPAKVPYLAAEESRARNWERRLEDEKQLKVGVVWAGSSAHVADKARSMLLASLSPLSGVDRVALYSLQKGPPAEQLASANFPITDLSTELQDYADTAAAVMALDLIITVDTSVAHLAGALARPVWTMLQFEPDWRWMLDRRDSPWYPTMRLFRQPNPGDWETVVRDVASELGEWAHQT